MISRAAVGLRWLRWKLGRTHWAARLLGIRTPAGEAENDGLIMLQIDGLSRTQFERALEAGNMPFLQRLIDRQHFALETFYSGVPSTTPAVQGEIFFGARAAVPAFQFLRRRTGKVLRMYEAEAAEEIESHLERDYPNPLLKGGHSYSNIYRAGAVVSKYCSQDLAPDEILKGLHPVKWIVLSFFYIPKILRMAGLAVLELALAVFDALKGLYEREDFLKELAFVPARVSVGIIIREMIRFRILLDIERGVQVIHANFLGYDEQAHRRGPDSAFAHWTLKGIDRAIRDIYRSALRSGYRDYELVVYSDHGQERTIPFRKRHGRGIDEAVAEVFSKGPLAGREIWISKVPEMVGLALERCRELLGLEPARDGIASIADPGTQIIITALGPLGHIYLPEMQDTAQMDGYAEELVAKAGIPLVLLRKDDGAVRAFNRRGEWSLPEDRLEVLGHDHPFSEEAAADLAALCGHPDAGDFVISGWDPAQAPLTFPGESGAHGGPGDEETRGFLLLPDKIRRWHVAHLPNTGRRVRGEELGMIARHFLEKGGAKERRVPHHVTREGDFSIRVLTYNIHSCIGIDGKVRPERVARVINQFDPDVIAVQEVDAHRLRSGGHDQAQVIADHLRMTHVFHAMLEEKKERYGIAVFARYPFKLMKADYLTEADPRLFREARGAIWLRVEPPGGRPFHFINTHFGLGRKERHRQVRELLGRHWLGGVADEEPVILCGDLNSGPRSKVYRMLRERFLDVQHAAPGHRPRCTFSSVKPLLRLDHVFVSPHFEVEHVDLPDTPTAVMASDHLPLFAKLTLRADDESD